MKKIWKTLLIIAGILVIIIAASYIWMTVDQKNKMEQLNFEEINMNDIDDGTYTGEASTGLVTVVVEVTVNNGTIKDIKLLKHDNGRGSKAETIIDEMIKENNYNIDAVSGATTSSQVIKSAVCNALLKGKKN
jgi:uncharacterized protein with FMN-binding domain